MKERPIIFSAPMVRAILDGRKTQTRRVVRPHPSPEATALKPWAAGWWKEWRGDVPTIDEFRCPYGVPGDRLWVRETFYCDDIYYPAGAPITSLWREVNGKRYAVPIEEQRVGMLDHMYYRADAPGGTCCELIPECDHEAGPAPWRSPIHMPRWASRLTLELTDVRVQRLQEISEDDAIAEGVEAPRTGPSAWGEPGEPVYEYMRRWDALNQKRTPWESNPWVWALTFRRLAA